MNLRALSVTEAHQQTGMPRTAILSLLESGQVAGNKLGKKWFISAESLSAWLNRTATPPAAPVVEQHDPENPFL